MIEKEKIKTIVKLGYADIAKKGGSCCSPSPGTAACCGAGTGRDIGKAIGYTDQEIDSVPVGSNLGLGCGNPVALASLTEGEVVLDLGSGAGFDCFLAANRVGNRGRVIGVDMTPEMIERARENAVKGGYENVEFRLGEIENLPVADNYVDVIISNCVINLSPDKERVFHEAYRVLKRGGRLMVSDIVLVEALPEAIQKSAAAYIGCIAGAVLKENYLECIERAGFLDIKIVDETGFGTEYIADQQNIGDILGDNILSKNNSRRLGRAIRSIKVSARKP